jgi:hypothetical protein
VRKTLSKWSRKHITFGSKTDWNKARQNACLPKSVEKTNFLMDSADFRLKGKFYTSVKDPNCSYKESSIKQRFMIGTDINTIILVLDGGYSPKLYDKHCLRMKRE